MVSSLYITYLFAERLTTKTGIFHEKRDLQSNVYAIHLYSVGLPVAIHRYTSAS